MLSTLLGFVHKNKLKSAMKSKKGKRSYVDHLSLATEFGATGKDFNVLGKTIKLSDHPDEIIGKTTLYKTITPLVLIDRKDRESVYKDARTAQEKALLVRQWLINNLVSIAYGIGLKPPISVNIPYIALREVPIKKKGIDMIGLRGEFATNMIIRGMGIGHLPSHGFGVTEKYRYGEAA